MSAEELKKLLDEAYQAFKEKATEEYHNAASSTKDNATDNSTTSEKAPELNNVNETNVEQEKNAPESKDTVTEEKRNGAYNALDDLHFILMQGSRNGYHFMTYLSNYADLKATTFKEEWFRHRLSFQLSVEDSVKVFGKRVASALPEHVCQYYDLLEGFSFRPYLNRGIDWDGWGVTDSGELISPYDEINK